MSISSLLSNSGVFSALFPKQSTGTSVSSFAPATSAAAPALGLGDQLAQQEKDLEEERRKKLLKQSQQVTMSPAAMALGLQRNSGSSTTGGMGF